MQKTLMKFDPATGEQRPYPSHASQWRKWFGKTAWLFDPWTGRRRDARDVGSDVQGLLIVPAGTLGMDMGDNDVETLAQRCEMAEKCLPQAEYRAAPERLHGDMLAEIERLRAALQPFANVGVWFYARPRVPDETPVVDLRGINGTAGSLTRGQFKSAHAALTPNDQHNRQP